MKKKIFTAIFFITSILWISTAWAQGRYVRKKVQPGFFIPESAMNKPEKLPEFTFPNNNIYIEQDVSTQTEEPTEAQAYVSDLIGNNSKTPPKAPKKQKKPLKKYQPAEDTYIEPAEAIEPVEIVETGDVNIFDDYENKEKNEQIEIKDDFRFDNSYVHLIAENEFDKLPEYKQKYEDYLNDLKYIAENGSIPENKTLYNDLNMMNSNSEIPVNENFGKK